MDQESCAYPIISQCACCKPCLKFQIKWPKQHRKVLAVAAIRLVNSQLMFNHLPLGLPLCVAQGKALPDNFPAWLGTDTDPLPHGKVFPGGQGLQIGCNSKGNNKTAESVRLQQAPAPFQQFPEELVAPVPGQCFFRACRFQGVPEVGRIADNQIVPACAVRIKGEEILPDYPDAI